MMPSTADELAALTRSSAARRPGSRNQGLLFNNEFFMGRFFSCLPRGYGDRFAIVAEGRASV